MKSVGALAIWLVPATVALAPAWAAARSHENVNKANNPLTPTIGLNRAAGSANAQITEAWSIHGDLSNPLPQSALIARLALGVPDRWTQQCQAARPSRTSPEALLHPGCQLAPLGSLQSFFWTTSCRICLSSVNFGGRHHSAS
jgi:hypothetical protein